MKKSVIVTIIGVLLIAGTAEYLVIWFSEKPDWTSFTIKNPDNVTLDTIAEVELEANRRLREIGVGHPERIKQIEKDDYGYVLHLTSHPRAASGHLLTLVPTSNGWRETAFGFWEE